MRIVPGASPVCSATSLMLSPSAMGGTAIVTGTDDATAGLIPFGAAPRSQDMTRVLIAGATGYVGSHLTPELLRRGLDVRALVRDPRTGAHAAAVVVLGPS
jgi:NAD(P)H-binding